jgi:hypothetical protein
VQYPGAIYHVMNRGDRPDNLPALARATAWLLAPDPAQTTAAVFAVHQPVDFSLNHFYRPQSN